MNNSLEKSSCGGSDVLVKVLVICHCSICIDDKLHWLLLSPHSIEIKMELVTRDTIICTIFILLVGYVVRFLWEKRT